MNKICIATILLLLQMAAFAQPPNIVIICVAPYSLPELREGECSNILPGSCHMGGVMRGDLQTLTKAVRLERHLGKNCI